VRGRTGAAAAGVAAASGGGAVARPAPWPKTPPRCGSRPAGAPSTSTPSRQRAGCGGLCSVACGARLGVGGGGWGFARFERTPVCAEWAGWPRPARLAAARRWGVLLAGSVSLQSEWGLEAGQTRSNSPSPKDKKIMQVTTMQLRAGGPASAGRAVRGCGSGCARPQAPRLLRAQRGRRAPAVGVRAMQEGEEGRG